jgi:hypothetical protein|tara:strand:- start:991 stop:2145 length:1155 start_codon:yes stop_codon:yes gene_type:complete
MEEKNENVVEETTQDQTVETVDESKFESAGDDSVIKVDLNKPPEEKEVENVQEEVVEETTDKKEIVEQSIEENSEEPVVEEITGEEVEEKVEELEEQVAEAIIESQETGKPIPENIQKLMDFMEETGGDLNDYARLNQDYSKLEDKDLLYEYYKQTKPHLNTEEINFLMEDTFSYDEEVDEERDIRRKKLALKEQVASAKAHLDGQKSKYYEEIKAGSKLTQEQQNAVDFFNRYNKESEVTKKVVNDNTKIFEQKTNKLFNDKFKGFEYQVGEKKFRFNVKDTEGIKKTQSDSNNFMTKFVDKNSALTDAKGYHKSLFTAMNADAVANHFYEQGKADAMKDSVAKAKNVNMQPRQQHGVVDVGGTKVKVLSDNSSDFKFQIKNK